MKPTLIVIGLGNPGKQYERTRHNAGFHAVDRLSKEFGVGDWEDKQKFQSFIQEARVLTVPVLLVKPKTFMNLSGDAVRKLVDFYKLDPSNQVLILYDDIDLPLGALRIRKSGGPGTHNGMRSIVPIYGEDVPRIRIGIGTPPAGTDLAAWVLSASTPQEQDTLQNTYDQLPEMLRSFILQTPAENNS